MKTLMLCIGVFAILDGVAFLTCIGHDLYVGNPSWWDGRVFVCVACYFVIIGVVLLSYAVYRVWSNRR